MSSLSAIYSLLYTLAIGGLFVYLFILTYDLLYGEKHEKQIKKIHKYFRNESVSKIDMLEHQPKKFTIYQVTTESEKKKIKMKPGYKVVKLVAKKNNK
jgi:hypothetical protein